jgi:hypothetical protein
LICERADDYIASLRYRLSESQTTSLSRVETHHMSTIQLAKYTSGLYDVQYPATLRQDRASGIFLTCPAFLSTSENDVFDPSPSSPRQDSPTLSSGSEDPSSISFSRMEAPQGNVKVRTGTPAPAPGERAARPLRSLKPLDKAADRASVQPSKQDSSSPHEKLVSHPATRSRRRESFSQNAVGVSSAGPNQIHARSSVQGVQLSVEIGAYLHNREQMMQIHLWFCQHLAETDHKYVRTLVSLFYLTASPTTFAQLRSALQTLRSSSNRSAMRGSDNDDIAATIQKLDTLEDEIVTASLIRRCLLLKLARHKAAIEARIRTERQGWRTIDKRRAKAGRTATVALNRMVKRAWRDVAAGSRLYKRKLKVMKNRLFWARHWVTSESKYPGLSLLLPTESDYEVNLER